MVIRDATYGDAPTTKLDNNFMAERLMAQFGEAPSESHHSELEQTFAKQQSSNHDLM
jgi:hypothetical protein